MKKSLTWIGILSMVSSVSAMAMASKSPVREAPGVICQLEILNSEALPPKLEMRNGYQVNLHAPNRRVIGMGRVSDGYLMVGTFLMSARTELSVAEIRDVIRQRRVSIEDLIADFNKMSDEQLLALQAQSLSKIDYSINVRFNDGEANTLKFNVRREKNWRDTEPDFRFYPSDLDEENLILTPDTLEKPFEILGLTGKCEGRLN